MWRAARALACAMAMGVGLAAVMGAVGCADAADADGVQRIGDLEVVAALPETWVIGVGSEVAVTVTRDGVGVAGLAPTATFIHVEHGHGGTTAPVVEDAGDGVYRVSRLTPSMAGTWRLTVGVESGTARWDVVVR